eukprot:GHVU01170358.1.p1 GENE.GHVU01170358.1~~GHVU01170358.1.p1  ORF type:complete len:253 (-),score=43.08 GHVU01170358.1:366-1124(-)
MAAPSPMSRERREEWDSQSFDREMGDSSEDSDEDHEGWDDDFDVMKAAHDRLDEGLLNAGITDDSLFNKYHRLLDRHSGALRTRLRPTDPPADVPGMRVTLKPGAQPSAQHARPAGEQVTNVVNSWAMAGLEAGHQRRPPGGTSNWSSPTHVVTRKGASIIPRNAERPTRTEVTESARRLSLEEDEQKPQLYAWAKVVIRTPRTPSSDGNSRTSSPKERTNCLRTSFVWSARSIQRESYDEPPTTTTIIIAE